MIICKNCVMDETDPNIKFDVNGVCNHCRNYYSNISQIWKNDGKNEDKLKILSANIKKETKNSEFNCILGISGGVDSSYLAYYTKEILGLNPLIFHVDAGWNSELAVSNIENVINNLNLELFTEVINWQEMQDLQLAYFKSGVPCLDTPQDHVFFASMYEFAVKNNIKYIFNGGKFSTECIREPLEWHYHASDLKHLKTIHSKFGKIKLDTLPTSDIFKYKIYYKYFKGIKVIQPLNYIKYIKEDAISLLKKKLNWKEYKYKHYESRFTRFYEGYWLIEKFGYDKRKAHLSSLILTNQITREEALNKINIKPFNADEIREDFSYISKKLGITESELKELFDMKNKSFKDYKSNHKLIQFFVSLSRILKLERRIIQ